MIDNSQLNSDMPGLAYRRSTSFDDRLDGVADGVATYGSVREGQLVDGWMKLVQIPMVEFPMPLSIVVFGATGDLAKKKLFPALYQLMFGCPDAPLLPVSTRIIGYGRSSVELGAFLEKQCANVQGQHRDEFLKAISYFQGGYSDESDFARLNSFLQASEGGLGQPALLLVRAADSLRLRLRENPSESSRVQGLYALDHRETLRARQPELPGAQ